MNNNFLQYQTINPSDPYRLAQSQNYDSFQVDNSSDQPWLQSRPLDSTSNWWWLIPLALVALVTYLAVKALRGYQEEQELNYRYATRYHQINRDTIEEEIDENDQKMRSLKPTSKNTNKRR